LERAGDEVVADVTPRRRRRVVVLVAALGVLGMSGPVGANAWVKRAGEARIYTEVSQVPARPVGIVLGARVWKSGEPSHSLEDRLQVALELYEAGKVEKLLVTGDNGQQGYNEVRVMFRWLEARGVPRDRIYVDHAGFRTLDSMERAARIFGVREAVICTQEFHLARSLFLAREAGIDAVGLVADKRIYEVRYKNAAREFVARTKAFLDIYVLGTEPHHMGEPIPITGPASASWDDEISVAARRSER
jgi:SanA protein